VTCANPVEHSAQGCTPSNPRVAGSNPAGGAGTTELSRRGERSAGGASKAHRRAPENWTHPGVCSSAGLEHPRVTLDSFASSNSPCQSLLSTRCVAITPRSTRSWICSTVRPSSDRSTGTVCSPKRGAAGQPLARGSGRASRFSPRIRSARPSGRSEVASDAATHRAERGRSPSRGLRRLNGLGEAGSSRVRFLVALGRCDRHVQLVAEAEEAHHQADCRSGESVDAVVGARLVSDGDDR
jgi:hypothetical protein